MIVLPAAAQAESLSNAGKEFWLGFPSNCTTACLDTPTYQTLYITGNTATTGTVAIPGLSFSETFSVTPGTVTSVALPTGTEMGSVSDGTEQKAIHVTAGAPVVVYGLNDEEYTTDAYTALPTDVIGTSYTVLAFGPGLGGNSEFSVVASQNGTTVTITPSVDGGAGDTRPAGTPYTVTLNQGEEYQLQATTNPEDLTGTKITSSAPVSVFGGQQCANVPNNGFFACDYLVEQNPPEDTWGTSFLTEPLKTRLHGDDFEMVADQNETHVELNGTLVATLNAGEHYSQEVEGASEWSSDKPIQLAQYSNSSTYDETTGDPFMINIPPYQQFETGYTITTPVNSKTVFENYVNLVVPKSEVGLVEIDGTAVPASEYNAIGSSAFEGVQVDLTPGSHVITGNGQPFGAFVYGFSVTNGYGYAGGFSLAKVATVTHVTLTPPTETVPVNTEHCVTATVTDEENEPVPGVRVDFVVEGPANSGGGSVFAEENGKATFCYTGTHVGKDTISGSVGLVKGTAEKTWIEEPPKPTQLSTSLSGGGQSGGTITVPKGTAVSDSATLSGANASKATGKVGYKVYSDKECTNLVTEAGEVEVTAGVIPASSAETLSPGTYYWQASYGGDPSNEASKSTCGSEVETVEVKTVEAQPHWYSNGTLIPEGQVEPVASSGELTLQVPGSKLSVTCKVKDKATIVNPAGGGAGTDETTEVVFSNCSGKASPCSSGKTSWCCKKKTSSPCEKGSRIELVPLGGTLRTHLVAVPGQPVRDVIEGVVLEVRCSNGTVLDTYSGNLTPIVGKSVLEFDSGSGELEDSTGAKATVSGKDWLTGPKGDEKITAKLPPLPPHWYSNGTLIPEGQVEPVASSGELTLQVPGSKLSVTCKVKDKATIVNPAGGGAGTDETTEVVFSSCSGKASPCSSGRTSWCCKKKSSSPCEKGAKIELASPAGTLRTHLIWSPGQPVRDVIEGVVLEVRCSNGTVLDTYSGNLMPIVERGYLRFDSGSGELEDQAGNKATLSGKDWLKGPKGDEWITVENPEGEPW